MAIQLHARHRGTEEWKIRNAFIDENKEVMMRETNPNIPAGSSLMTRDKLNALAVGRMNAWINCGNDYDTEFRVVDTATLPKAERQGFEKGRT